MALRFARVKGYRHDKRPEDADTIDTVRAIFEGSAAGDTRVANSFEGDVEGGEP